MNASCGSGRSNSAKRRLRNISRPNYKDLHEKGEYNYIDRFNLPRTVVRVETDSSDSSLSIPGSPISNSGSTSEEVDNSIVAKAFELHPSHLFDNNSTMSTKEAEEVVLEEKEQLEILGDEFADFLDENGMDQIEMNADDYDDYISRLEEFRKYYKGIERSIKKKVSKEEFEEEFATEIFDALDKIKNCIKEAKERKNKLRKNAMADQLNEKSMKERERKEKMIQKYDALEFLIKEITRLIGEMYKEFDTDLEKVDDEELLRRKDDYAENTLQLERLSNKIQQAYQIIPVDYDQNIVNKMKRDYDLLLTQKKIYDNSLDVQIKEREILKEKAFQTSALNIKIPKFKGYDSPLDIYSFQSEFEKLYLRDTPKKLLADLLKNNYLADPALCMVKTQQDIDEIWKRLKKAYGDKKILLTHKLKDVTKVGYMLKSRDLEQLKEGLMKVVNAMNDLIELAEKHRIEEKLYHGDGLNTIYGLLGDNRLTRWLTKLSEEDDIEGKLLWKKLIKFLEKELKVVQEKALIVSSIPKPNLPPPPRERSNRNQSHLTNNSDNDNSGGSQNSTHICHWCNQPGHITTYGANKTQLVQYFSCEKFCNTPIEQKFRELRAKNLCHQCLYPGAKQSEGKHKDGTCQKTYTCKHPSHDSYPRKKHVLVCAEHCETEENKKLFNEYKSRFILSQKNSLAEFTREIKLSFHVHDSYKASSLVKKNIIPTVDDNGIPDDDSAIYGLQLIEVDGQRYLLFYDSGASDLVTKFDAIRRLKGRAVKEIEGPLEIGPLERVGDLKVSTQHGVYRIRIPMYDGKNASMSGICLENITGRFPTFPLNTLVKEDIEREYQKSGGDICDLSTLPNDIGGDADIMNGAKYLRYCPKEIFRLPSGLTIYESKFINADGGGRGVICGPHPIFNKIVQHANLSVTHSLL